MRNQASARTLFLGTFIGAFIMAANAIAAPPAATPAPPAATPATSPAQADAPTYALLSLIGDKLDIVIAHSGSGTDRSRREPPLDITDPVFDNLAATAAGEAIRRVTPRAELALLNSRSPVLFAKQAELFEEKNGVVSIPDAIRSALKNEKADYLVLIAKHRSESEFQVAGFPDGTGLIEGLGFYLDGATIVDSREGSEAGRGYIAPFVYMKVWLVDAKTGKLLGRHTVKASTVISSARALDGKTSPWAALTSAEKIGAINRLIQRELQRVMPQILKGATQK
ncbi:MAG: hypothetical protein ABI905_00610 [Betaproteobacteria bacterium]